MLKISKLQSWRALIIPLIIIVGIIGVVIGVIYLYQQPEVEPKIELSPVSAGFDHTCALLEDRTIKCWGSNLSGRLGDGTTIERHTPVSVSGITTATAVSAGNSHTCALLADDTIKCWGLNRHGQLGDGTTAERHIPVSVRLEE